MVGCINWNEEAFIANLYIKGFTFQKTECFTCFKFCGIEDDFLEMYFVSGGMGDTFANAMREMTERLRELGPNPLK